MTSFSHILILAEKDLQFFFLKRFTPSGEVYFITVNPPCGKEVHFEMKAASEKRWMIVPPAPDWVWNEEERLSHVINLFNEKKLKRGKK